MKIKNIYLICIIILIPILFSSCSQIDTLEVKVGLKNSDFDYMKQGKVSEIDIQNERDNGYKFIITNEKAILDVYNILSDAKPATTKSNLKPDYEFDIYIKGQKDPLKFKYIVGLDSKAGGNLYSNDKCYYVPNRIDTDIIKNFDDTRTPKDFSKLYYTFIEQCITKYRNDTKASNKEIGIDMYDDLDVQKYIFSADLADFENSLPSNCKVLESENDTAPITETVTTDGYKFGSFSYKGKSLTGYLYKSTVVFYDNDTKEQKKYSIVGTYTSNDDSWNIDISSTN